MDNLRKTPVFQLKQSNLPFTSYLSLYLSHFTLYISLNEQVVREKRVSHCLSHYTCLTSKSCVKSTCWDTHATDSIIKSGQKDTEASIGSFYVDQTPIPFISALARASLNPNRPGLFSRSPGGGLRCPDAKNQG